MIALTAEDRRIIGALNFKSPWTWIATAMGLGFFRPAPGTWGSLGAIPCALVINGLWGQAGLLLAIIAVAALGYHAAGHFQKMTGTDDCKMVVIDEVCGQWIALLAAGQNWKLVIIAFVFFRLLDIIKPGPVGWMETHAGPRGVMADDIVAGLIAAFCVIGMKHAGFD